MATDVVSMDSEATVKDAAGKMAQHEIGSLVVTEQGKPVGIITESDLVSRVLATGKNADTTRVKMIMSKPLICGEPEADAIEAARYMVSRNIKKLPITRDGHLVGIITFTDLGTIEPDLARITEEETRGKIPKKFIKRLAKRRFGT
jgi:CBS domain-containing protein